MLPNLYVHLFVPKKCDLFVGVRHALIREEFLKSLYLEIVHFEDIAIKKAMDGVVGQVMLSIQNREKYIESLVR